MGGSTTSLLRGVVLHLPDETHCQCGEDRNARVKGSQIGYIWLSVFRFQVGRMVGTLPSHDSTTTTTEPCKMLCGESGPKWAGNQILQMFKQKSCWKMLDNSGWLSSEEPEYDITKSDDDRMYISHILNIVLDNLQTSY